MSGTWIRSCSEWRQVNVLDRSVHFMQNVLSVFLFNHFGHVLIRDSKRMGTTWCSGGMSAPSFVSSGDKHWVSYV